MRSSETSARDFARVIASDPSLTARLLRLVNSSLYGLRQSIDTVSHAVTAVGLRELYSLVVAVSALRTFVSIPAELVDMDRFWRHSIHCGLVAKALAQRLSTPQPERSFVVGLLHDIGCLVLFDRLPDLSAEILARADGDEDALVAHEVEVLGYSHCTLGGLLLRQWQLPECLALAVESHHESPSREPHASGALLVQLADLLSNHSEPSAMLRQPTIDGGGLRGVGFALEKIDVPALLQEVDTELSQTIKILAMRDE